MNTMILADTVRQSLDEHVRPGSGAQTAHVAGPGFSCELDLERADDLACALLRLRVVPAQPPTASLRDRSQTLAGRVTGLLEPLQVIEVDAGQGAAQLRSQSPAARGDDRAYYELMLEGDGRATLRRYLGHADAPRSPTPFTITRDALAKLITDLVS
ncbi:MAG TPA: hypothetical protein PKC45_15340 [Gemmatales bacterium]|nr:hypothetical protein [Gemmatales bacterium]